MVGLGIAGLSMLSSLFWLVPVVGSDVLNRVAVVVALLIRSILTFFFVFFVP